MRGRYEKRPRFTTGPLLIGQEKKIMKVPWTNIIKNGRVSQRDRHLSNEKTISYGKDIKNDRISQHGRFS